MNLAPVHDEDPVTRASEGDVSTSSPRTRLSPDSVSTSIGQTFEPFSRDQLLHLFTSAPNAFWRHDIDLSLDAAVRMARFAQIAGVQSTFYVMVRSPFYNPFSPDGTQALEAILGCGHRLGLHCDYRTGDVEQVVGYQWALLDQAYPGWFYRMVSFHMPVEGVLWTDFDGFENAYASRWEGRYVSDSRGAPITEPVTDEMQISLHPEHWQL